MPAGPSLEIKRSNATPASIPDPVPDSATSWQDTLVALAVREVRELDLRGQQHDARMLRHPHTGRHGAHQLGPFAFLLLTQFTIRATHMCYFHRKPKWPIGGVQSIQIPSRMERYTCILAP
jgi:hypothetical protein